MKAPSAPSRAAGTPGINKNRFGNIMDSFMLQHVTGMNPNEFEAKVREFVTKNPYDKWYTAWKENDGTFLQTLCWGFDRILSPKFFIRGGMDDRHITNLERIAKPNGIIVNRHIKNKTVCVIGCWTGEEILMMSHLGAVKVDGIEEVSQYADMANLQINAFGINGYVKGRSLYEVYEKINPVYNLVYMPGVMYHLTDPVAAMLIIWAMLKDNGIFAFETVYSPQIEGRDARYLGPNIKGWNWWAPSSKCYLAMMQDTGFVNCRQVDHVPGRAWFMGEKANRIPLVETGAAGFSRPDILRFLRL